MKATAVRNGENDVIHVVIHTAENGVALHASGDYKEVSATLERALKLASDAANATFFKGGIWDVPITVSDDGWDDEWPDDSTYDGEFEREVFSPAHQDYIMRNDVND